jgi:multidrug efflux system membrane fusion protein
MWALTTVIAVALLSSCSGETKAQLPAADKTKKEVPSAALAPVSKSNVNEYRLLGQVSSQEKIFLSFKVTGIIRNLFVKPGMKVKKGQVVADLDDVQFKLRADNAKLQFDKATNQKAQADRDFTIEKELHAKDISSLTQFQNAELTYKNAVIGHDMAEVDLKTANQTLTDSRLTAPVDGTISQQFKFSGDKTDGTAFEMFASVEPEIYLNAPESLLSKISIGSQLDVSFPSIDLRRKAQIVRIVPAVRENDRTFLVVAKLTERDPLIVPGIFAEAIVTTPRK